MGYVCHVKNIDMDFPTVAATKSWWLWYTLRLRLNSEIDIRRHRQF
jgi:hypothetical protein